MSHLYTAEALATGDGRNGHGRTSDGRVDVDLATPKELGGTGEGTNPEQLFAVGYAACFHSALRVVARADKADVTDLLSGHGCRWIPTRKGASASRWNWRSHYPPSTRPPLRNWRRRHIRCARTPTRLAAMSMSH